MVRDYYCASMLLLLKPWRSVSCDLKREDQSWQDAFDEFKQLASGHTLNIIDNIQFYYKARAAADSDKDAPPDLEDMEDQPENEGQGQEEYDETEALEIVQRTSVVPAESCCLARFGSTALDVARERGIFSSSPPRWMCASSPSLASVQSVLQVCKWKDLLSAANESNESGSSEDVGCRAKSKRRGPPRKRPKVMRTDQVSSGSSSRQNGLHDLAVPIKCLELCQDLNLDVLNDAQYRAFDIVARQMELRLNGHHPPPLRMRLTGCPGTGKSKVIETITKAMKRWGLDDRMLRAAYTGIAASAIDGQTIHSILCAQGTHIPPDISESRRKKLQALWDNKVLLIIDEDSMINKTLLSKLVRAVAVGRSPSDPNIGALPFGDLDVVFCGDDHQFPPVAKAAAERLYYHMDLAHDTPERAEGKRVRDSLETVVVLRDQVSKFF